MALRKRPPNGIIHKKIMEQISSLFNFEDKKSKAGSERATLIEFFVDNVKDRKGKKYKPSFIAMRVSHLKLADLYYMMSQAKEYEKKGGEIGKYFFGSLRVKDGV